MWRRAVLLVLLLVVGPDPARASGAPWLQRLVGRVFGNRQARNLLTTHRWTSPALELHHVGLPRIEVAVPLPRLLYRDLALTVHEETTPVAEALHVGLAPSVEEIVSRLEAAKGTGPLSLLDVTPSFVGKQSGKRNASNGPNCWNATLNWFSEVGVRFTSDTQLAEHLNTRFHEVDDLRYGDILAFSNRRGLVHTAVFINPKWAWHKGGYHRDRGWGFERLGSVMRLYGLRSPWRGDVKVWRENTPEAPSSTSGAPTQAVAGP